MRAAGLWVAARLVLVRLRFVGLVALAAALAGSLDELSALARRVRGAGEAPAAVARAGRYACPMHPDAVRGEPGKCPACGMPLRRVEADEPAHVALTSDQVKLGGLTFATVERRPLDQELTALAELALDERRVAVVSTPLRARVLAVHVAAPGTPVRRGERLATVSSREIYQLGRDLQLDLPTSDATHVLARQRLLQFGLTEAQLDRLAHGRDPTAFELLSPMDGVLVSTSAVAGDQVPEMAGLFRVADLSRLWLVTRLREADALLVGPGTALEAELVAAPGQVLSTRVSWLDATVDAATRTLAVRALVDNPTGLLRPGMTGRARLRVPVGSPEAPPLLVPASAVVDTGLTQTVWREDEAGVLEPVEVKVGARVGPLCVIASGLREGERVVAQGAFLLSADQRLKPTAGPTAEAPQPMQGDDE
jgi:Cu(I)/Ag(I) efflux system membrane fusion protein